MKKKTESSTSTQSAKNGTPKALMTPQKPGMSMTVSGLGEVLSRSLISPLAEVYETEEFKSAWANEVRFHMARNLLHLRRYRQMSQGAVGKAMGTSQSAVARIESAQENITLDTLQRMIRALDGRFYISIRPSELQRSHENPWWDALSSGVSSQGDWKVKAAASRQIRGTNELLVWLQQGIVQRSETLPAGNLLPEAGAR